MDIASLVTLLSAAAWLGAVLMVVFFVMQASRGKPVAKGGSIPAGRCSPRYGAINCQRGTGLHRTG